MPDASEPAKPAPRMNRWHAAAVLTIILLGAALTAAVLQLASLGGRDAELCREARMDLGAVVFTMGEAAGRADEQGFGNLSRSLYIPHEVVIQTCALSPDERGFYIHLATALGNMEVGPMSDTTHLYLWQDAAALAVVHDALFGPDLTQPGIGFRVQDNRWQEASALLQTMGQDLRGLGYLYIVPQ